MVESEISEQANEQQNSYEFPALNFFSTGRCGIVILRGRHLTLNFIVHRFITILEDQLYKFFFFPPLCLQHKHNRLD